MRVAGASVKHLIRASKVVPSRNLTRHFVFDKSSAQAVEMTKRGAAGSLSVGLIDSYRATLLLVERCDNKTALVTE
jgi:hypothetical protein